MAGNELTLNGWPIITHTAAGTIGCRKTVSGPPDSQNAVSFPALFFSRLAVEHDSADDRKGDQPCH